MSEFRPTIFIKEKCPFCLKLRIGLLEAGMDREVDWKEHAPDSAAEEKAKDTLGGKLEKVTFPAAEIAPGQYMTDSDAILDQFLAKKGVDRKTLPVLDSYVTGAFQGLMDLYRENVELRNKLNG
jgi:glutaredoxin